MKFAVITTIRNEQDILNTFLNHIDALFDDVYLLDHRSIDGSGEIIRSAVRQKNSWTYIKMDMNGYYQKETSKLLMQHCFRKETDVVFFLDCDEFLQVKNRAELEGKVKAIYDNATGGYFRWINCVTDKLNDSRIKYRSNIWINPEPTKFRKICIPKSLFDQYNGNLSVCQGNHEIIDPDGNFMITTEIGHLIHLPVRSKNQLVIKAIQSSISHLSRKTRLADENYQFFEMMKIIAAGDIPDDTVRGCINLYQNEAKVIPISKGDLVKKFQKTSLSDLGIASTQKINPIKLRKQPRMIELLLAEHILSMKNENPENIVFDEKEGKISIN